MSREDDEKRDVAAAGAWALLGLVLLAFTVFSGVRAGVTFGLLGTGGHIVASRCVEGGGKGGPYVECEGSFIDSHGVRNGRRVTVRLPSAEEGDLIPAHRAPWGTYEALDNSLRAEAGWCLLSMVLTAAVAGCFVRASTMVRRPARRDRQ